MISVTWKTYLIASFILLGIYYATVVLLYAKKAGQPLLRRKNIQPPRKSVEKGNEVVTGVPDYPQEQHHDEIEQLPLDGATAMAIQNLVDELQAFAAAAGKNNMTKEELMAGVQSILDKYPGIAGTDMQDGISSLIVVTLENNCAVHLDDSEVSELWRG
ncbi:hypothetical protein [Filimonas effusa]|uniref:Uncharacterized protein n=1 Tax=Filimonas effusa TaxID=2508721 RepID=A0A4Q1D2J5_9BACT|nr:hypothetical protein [Filimonas effusa]RXK81285.1 hypothetical protein ESB13_20325 [Filimonas effusa]